MVSEVIAFIVDNRPLGQGFRFVENEAPLIDTCSQRAHMANVRDPKVLRKPPPLLKPLAVSRQETN